MNLGELIQPSIMAKLVILRQQQPWRTLFFTAVKNTRFLIIEWGGMPTAFPSKLTLWTPNSHCESQNDCCLMRSLLIQNTLSAGNQESESLAQALLSVIRSIFLFLQWEYGPLHFQIHKIAMKITFNNPESAYNLYAKVSFCYRMPIPVLSLQLWTKQENHSES